ncbi:MAG: DNA-directed RNA polymerase subunit alpha C-terminal domain-containing protein [Anaerolineae bacterium]
MEDALPRKWQSGLRRLLRRGQRSDSALADGRASPVNSVVRLSPDSPPEPEQASPSSLHLSAGPSRRISEASALQSNGSLSDRSGLRGLEPAADKALQAQPDPDEGSILSLRLPSRASSPLLHHGVHTVRELTSLTREELSGLRGVGMSSLLDIERALQRAGLSLAPSRPSPAGSGASQDALPSPSRRSKPSHQRLDTEPQRTPASLQALGLSNRAHNALARNGVRSVDALCRLTGDEVAAMRGIGAHSLLDIEARLARAGLSLAPAPPQAELAAPASELVNSRQAATQPSPDAETFRSLELEPTTIDALYDAGIYTVGEIVRLPPRALGGLPGITQRMLGEIHRKLSRVGLSLAAAVSEPAPADAPLAPDLVGDDTPLRHLHVGRARLGPLLRRGTTTVGQVAAMTERQLLELPYFGVASLQALQAALDRHRAQRTLQPVPAARTSDTSAAAPVALPPATPAPEPARALSETVRLWLDRLPARERAILCRRLGLGCAQATLDELGREQRLTRERVRQIEKRVLERLDRGMAGRALRGHLPKVRELLDRLGGVLTTDDIDQHLPLTVPLGDLAPRDAAALFALVDDALVWPSREQLLVLKHLWKGPLPTLWDELEAAAADGIDDAQDLVFRVASSWAFRDDTVTPDTVRAALRSHPKLQVVEGRVARGPQRQGPPARALQETIEALGAIGRPAHYSEIAAMVAQMRGGERAPTARSVYMRIMKFSEHFTRAGRGIYGLAEWGLPNDGSVANAVVRVLTEAGEPLSIIEVQDRVLAAWQVEESTIYQAMISDPRVVSVRPGVYGLAAWNGNTHGR